MKVVASWSGGKESCFAMYEAFSEGFEVSCLLNFVSKNGRCMSHGLDSKLILAQSEAVGIPLVQKEVSWETYDFGFKSAMCELKRNGIKGAVFGDIYEIPRHEGWIDRVCGELGIKPIKPLWGSDPEHILNDFIEEGFEALVVKVKADLLGEEWLAQKIDKPFIKNILKLKENACLDPCGELGEYHTFVYDGPIFKKRLDILDFKKKLMEGYWFLDVKEFRIVDR